MHNISIPSSVSGIGTCAFLGCSSLSNVTIPYGVQFIRASSFRGCNLTNITIPSTVTTIGTYAFFDCHNLVSINVDEGNGSFEDINGVLFSRDGTLVSYPCGKEGGYDIPYGVKRINGFSFGGCKKLSSVTIPSSVEIIGNSPFHSCTGLESINVNRSNQYYKSIDGVLFTKDGSALIQYPCGSNESYSIPDGVFEIKYNAFAGCMYLKNVVISSSVSRIEEESFLE